MKTCAINFKRPGLLKEEEEKEFRSSNESKMNTLPPFPNDLQDLNFPSISH
jgi:hypothetical protein